jgi:hypothetical protein
MVDPQSFGFDSNAILAVSGISFLFEHDLSNLPSPAEASNQMTARAEASRRRETGSTFRDHAP